MEPDFVIEVTPPDELTEPAHWFAFRQDELLVRQDGGKADVPRAMTLQELGLAPVRIQYLGRLAGCPCFSAELPPESQPPEGSAFAGLRSLYGRLQETEFATARRAILLVNWDRNHQFCGRCGTPMVKRPDENAKECPQCGLLSYPRISPAIIVAVVRDNRILLARAHRYQPGFYSVLAGFVEPGENLEEAVRREVREEVGIELEDIRYFGSQSWPFPDSLMIAFTARYAGGEIVPEPGEIEDAGWFRADELPLIPGPISTSRRLIDWFVTQQIGNP